MRSPPRQLDRARLLPMYEALHARTRAADNETIILYALLAQAGRAGAGGAARGAENKKKKTNDTRFLVLFACESGQKWLRRSRPMVYYARWICPLFTYISCTFGHFPCEFCRCFYRSVWSSCDMAVAGSAGLNAAGIMPKVHDK